MIVDCAIYENGVRRDGKVELAHAYDERHQPGKFVWIGLYEPTEEEFDSLRREFDLHPLAVEDAIHAHQRPKLEVYDDMVFLVLKTARYVDPTEVIELGEVLVFLGDFLITVRHGEASSLTPVREALDADPAPEARPGLGAARDPRPHRRRLPAGDRGLEKDIDEVEEQLLRRARNPPSGSTGSSARCSASARPPRRSWTRSTSWPAGTTADPPEMRDYFRDVNDHLMRARDQLDAMRDLLSSSLQANLAQVACARTRTCAGSRPGSRSSPCPPPSPASTA